MAGDAVRPADEGPRARPPRAAGFWADLGTIPNVLSLTRLFGLPIAALLYIYGFHAVGLTLGTVASLTDALDGYLARRLNMTTPLGAILDRLGDLVLEASAFVCIVHFHLMTPIVAIVYVVREMIVLSARQFVAEQGETIKTNTIGRLKTDFLAFSFFVMFAVHAGAIGDPGLAATILGISRGGILVGLACAYVSGVQYLIQFARIYDRRASRPAG
jgi:CDP-diacylglycerol--glycerol-3-phosphate 3-phosphatidyltransferase